MELGQGAGTAQCSGPEHGKPKVGRVNVTGCFFLKNPSMSKKSWSFRCQFSNFFLKAAMKTNLQLCYQFVFNFGDVLSISLLICAAFFTTFITTPKRLSHQIIPKKPTLNLCETEIWWAQRGQQCGNHPSDGLQKLSGTQGEKMRKTMVFLGVNRSVCNVDWMAKYQGMIPHLPCFFWVETYWENPLEFLTKNINSIRSGQIWRKSRRQVFGIVTGFFRVTFLGVLSDLFRG